ncbi:hypothetical protein U1Q18_024122, partial [Sarracenia purpurea var. burkii]
SESTRTDLNRRGQISVLVLEQAALVSEDGGTALTSRVVALRGVGSDGSEQTTTVSTQRRGAGLQGWQCGCSASEQAAVRRGARYHSSPADSPHPFSSSSFPSSAARRTSSTLSLISNKCPTARHG